MSNLRYFQQAAAMRGDVAIVQQYYNELVAQFLKSNEIGLYKSQEESSKSKPVPYNLDHFHLNKLDRYIDQLKDIKDNIGNLRANLNQRSVLFKHGNLKKKLDAILTREDVVRQLRTLKTLRAALDRFITSGQYKPLVDYLGTLNKTEIYEKVNPETNFAWNPTVKFTDGVDTTGLTIHTPGLRTA